MIGPTRYIPTPGRVVQAPRLQSCGRYSKCLLKAASQNWPSFTCRGCKLATRGKLAAPQDLGRAPALEDTTPVNDWAPARPEWKYPTPARNLECSRCGREGTARLVHQVEGEPACILCRPDLGAPVHPEWAWRLEHRGHLASNAPLLPLRQLAGMTGFTVGGVWERIRKGRLVHYHADRGLMLVPAAQLGVATPPGPDDEQLEPGLVRELLHAKPSHRRVEQLVAGHQAVPWLELAHHLASTCSVNLGGNHAH